MSASIILTGSPEALDAITKAPIHLDMFGHVRFDKDGSRSGVEWVDAS